MIVMWGEASRLLEIATLFLDPNLVIMNNNRMGLDSSESPGHCRGCLQSDGNLNPSSTHSSSMTLGKLISLRLSFLISKRWIIR